MKNSFVVVDQRHSW